MLPRKLRRLKEENSLYLLLNSLITIGAVLRPSEQSCGHMVLQYCSWENIQRTLKPLHDRHLLLHVDCGATHSSYVQSTSGPYQWMNDKDKEVICRKMHRAVSYRVQRVKPDSQFQCHVFFLSCVKSRGNYGHESEVGVLGMRREETGWERKDCREREKHIPDTINVCW